MKLSIPERIEIVLLYGRQGWSEDQTADKFNRLHPERQDPLVRQLLVELWHYYFIFVLYTIADDLPDLYSHISNACILNSIHTLCCTPY